MLWALKEFLFSHLKVYVSYDYGGTFTLISDKFQLSKDKKKDGSKQVISQFYHSPADNRRVSFCSRDDSALEPFPPAGQIAPHEPAKERICHLGGLWSLPESNSLVTCDHIG